MRPSIVKSVSKLTAKWCDQNHFSFRKNDGLVHSMAGHVTETETRKQK